jgi:hypothetical protein
MASLISSPMACCSRRSSLQDYQYRDRLEKNDACQGRNIHDVVHLVDGQASMYLLHSSARILHGIQRLLVDVGRLDRVNLLLQRHDLCACLLERVFKLLLSP